jgi:O-antigen/teichoic acid export membrane protein
LGLSAKVTREARWIPIVGNQLATLALGIVGLKLVSYLVPPAVNGVYALFLTLTQLGTLLTHSGILNHATRNWQRERPRHASYVRFLWGASWGALGYLAPILAVAATGMFLRGGQLAWVWAFPLLLVSNLGLALTEIAALTLNAGERHWAVFGLRAGGGAFRTFVPIVFVLVFAADFLVLSAGFALHAVIAIGIILFIFRWAWGAPSAGPDTEHRWRRELREYGRPFILLGVGGWLLQSADRWVVVQFYGEEQAGLFALATSLGAVVPTLAVSALMQRVFPEVFRQADRARTLADWQALARRCDRATLLFLGLTLGGLLSLHWLGPQLVGWLIHPRYGPAMSMLLWAGLAMVTVQVNQFHYLLLQGQHNSTAMVKVMACVSGVKTLGSVITAAISWPLFLSWLAVSVLVSAWLGRFLIHRIALTAVSVPAVRED